jgi:hypothetical protein
LLASIAAKPKFGSSQNTSYYPTWKLASTNLHAVLNSLWESLEPETEKIIGNVELLPTINNPDSLPYHDHNNHVTLFVAKLPECLIPQQKLVSKDKISCFLEIKCETMWEAIYYMLFVILKTQRFVTWCL